MKTYLNTILATLFLSILFSPMKASAQVECPVMEDAYHAIERASINLTKTRFTTSQAVKDSQKQLNDAKIEIAMLMAKENCTRHEVNPLPLYYLGYYKGNCPVMISAENFTLRALGDVPKVSKLFRSQMDTTIKLLSKVMLNLTLITSDQFCQE